MLKELRKIEKRSKQMHIRNLQYQKLIKKYINEKGYLCYNTDELEEYKSKVHRGRPAKID